MKEMLQLYEEVLKELPFSIIGHNNLPEKLYAFYNNLSDSNFIKYNPNFTFLCSAFLKFKKDEKSHLDWKVESYDKFYYKSFLNVDKRAVVSIYFCLLQNFSEYVDNSDAPLRPSLVFSELFGEDLDFKISLFDGEIGPFVDYNRDMQVFEVKLPKSIFKKEYLEKNYYRISLIKEFENNSEYLLQNPDKYHSRYYSSYNDSAKKDFDDYCDKLFNKSVLDGPNGEKGVKDNLVEDLELFEDKDIFIKPIKDGLYEEFAYCCFALSFWCLHYDSTVEYMMSVAMVEKKPNKIIEKRNLGGLIIGYRKDYELTSEERAIFNITSDHLTSVVAGQKLYEEGKELRIGKRREKLKQALIGFNILFKDTNFLHGDDPLDEKKIQKVKNYIQNNKEWLTPEFQKKFDNLCKRNNNYINKYWLTKLTKEKYPHREHIDPGNTPFADTDQYENLKVGSISFDYINVPFIEYIFARFSDGGQIGRLHIYDEQTDCKTISCEIHSLEFDYEEFIKSIKESNPMSNLVGKIFIRNYLLLTAHGNLQVWHRSTLLFDVYDFIEDVVNNNIKLKVDLDEKCKELSTTIFNELEIRFINELK